MSRDLLNLGTPGSSEKMAKEGQLVQIPGSSGFTQQATKAATSPQDLVAVV